MFLCRPCLVCMWVLWVVGCGSSNTTTLALEAQTLIGVDPKDFTEEGACGTTLKSYVGTLFDVTGSDGISDAGVSATPFLVGSSPPTPCDRAIVFNYAVAAHAYEVNLDGYDRSDIKPAVPGSSAMVTVDANQTFVARRWTAVCHGWTDTNGNAAPGLSYSNITVTLRECTKLASPVH
jgi:hypothetical protein